MTGKSSGSPGSPPRRPYDTFRPVRGAWVARGCAIASVVVFSLVAAFSPMAFGTSARMESLNRVAIAILGLAIAAFLWRYAVIRAVPDRSGLLVVNLIQRHQLEWAEILRVSFSHGSPWVVLELTDTTELAVMAIQRADGARAHAEASRLAALVEHHNEPS